jgi:hypothetical protein
MGSRASASLIVGIDCAEICFLHSSIPDGAERAASFGLDAFLLPGFAFLGFSRHNQWLSHHLMFVLRYYECGG